MRVLVTGATGYIGSAVAAALKTAGHTVTALAHSAEVESETRAAGYRAVRGDLKDVAALRELAGNHDGVIHAANTGGADAAAVDVAATRAMLHGLEGTGRPFVYTSGAWVLGPGRSDEGSPLSPPAIVAWRRGLEAEVMRAAPGVRAVVVRPGVAFGRSGGIPGMVIRGELPVLGSGSQRWPMVHVDDLAELYVRALEAPAGSILHGVGEAVSMTEIARARGDAAEPPAALEEGAARAQFGDFADALLQDQAVSSVRTRGLTGWQPRRSWAREAQGVLVGSV
jgi:nucleoside-diphosphate-sugar epimerase